MITDSISKLDCYQEFIPATEAIQKFVSTREMPEAGKWIFLEDGVKVILLESSNYQHGILETHRMFFDLHMTITGCDLINISDYSLLQSYQQYDTEKDYALWQGNSQNTIDLLPGCFLFLLPHEAHNNNFLKNQTSKFVVKIPVNHG
jgi:YhcH/YjgK/YiaL family protein